LRIDLVGATFEKKLKIGLVNFLKNFVKIKSSLINKKNKKNALNPNGGTTNRGGA
jgi:hypothetical protein